MPIQASTKAQIADLQAQIADRLEQQDDNPYRVQAFRNRARSVRTIDRPLTEIDNEEGGESLLTGARHR